MATLASRESGSYEFEHRSGSPNGRERTRSARGGCAASSTPFQGQQGAHYLVQPPPPGYPTAATSTGAAPAGNYPVYGAPPAPAATQGQAKPQHVLWGNEAQQSPAAFDVEAQHATEHIGAAQAAAAAAAFGEQQVRRGFVRKVLLLVFLQLLTTVGIGCVFYFVDQLRNYVQDNTWVFWVSWLLAFGSLIALMCNPAIGRKHPWNYIFLAWFTIVFSFLVGTVTSFYDTRVVVIAMIATATAVGALTLIAVFAPFDITHYGSIIAASSLVLLVMLLVGLLWHSPVFHLVIACFGAALFSVYLVYDLQLIMGGREVSLGPDEFVFATIKIYLDIINLFLVILSIVGFASR